MIHAPLEVEGDTALVKDSAQDTKLAFFFFGKGDSLAVSMKVLASRLQWTNDGT